MLPSDGLGQRVVAIVLIQLNVLRTDRGTIALSVNISRGCAFSGM